MTMTTGDRDELIELLDQINEQNDQLATLAEAFGWVRPTPGAPASTEICRSQAAALRRAVAAIIDSKVPSKPTLEQKKALKLFIDIGDDSLSDREINTQQIMVASELCRWIAALEATKIPFDLGKTPDADGYVTIPRTNYLALSSRGKPLPRQSARRLFTRSKEDTSHGRHHI